MSAVDSRGDALRLGLAVLIGVAFTGFFVGTTDDVASSATLRELPATSAEGVVEAPDYRGLRLDARGAGPGWEEERVALAALSPSRLDPVEIDAAGLAGTLAARASRRAYDGAPPTVPHPVDQGGYPECLACHEEGLRLRASTAPAIPHGELTSCTQCHVSTADAVPTGGVDSPGPDAAGNLFVGLASPAAGPRAWSIAPPQIPHQSWMRENCLSCHGVNGANPMRSTHPSRESCTQCHTSTAERDLRAWAEGG